MQHGNKIKLMWFSRRLMPWTLSTVSGIAFWTLFGPMGAAWPQAGTTKAEVPAEAAEFFEKRVRPVLAENCFKCHGEQLQMAGLRLDSLAGLLKGTSSGHVVLSPGEPDKSALVQAIRYTGQIKMPPPGRLPDKDIDAITAWVKMGAPWPGDTHTKSSEEIAGEQLFEKNVRPIFARRCFTCHTDMASSGLRVDSRESLLKGGTRGPAIVPGKPEESLLIRAVSHTNPRLKMPFGGEKLQDQEIEALRAWIKTGAPWPDSPAGKPDEHLARGRWAFEPVKAGPIPLVKNQVWVKTPVDSFILAKLEERNLSPAKPADRRTLIRRASYDLVGLPPTPEEVRAFEADTAPDAFARLVDRYLSSPHYGERWGRHWLDVARYGDTKGLFFSEELRYPFAYTYRDWVIRAFNEDMPYDRFIRLQIAADQLTQGEDKRQLAAMGFLTLGRKFEDKVPLIIDDRLDVVFRGLQALTIGCARCHDHKYDPIPTKDYYSLYGVFDGSEEKTLPLMAAATEEKRFRAYQEELDKREKAVKDFLQAEQAELLPKFRKQVGSYLLAAHAAQMLRPPERGLSLNLVLVERWRAYIEETSKKFDPVFAPWNGFAALSEEEFTSKAPALAAAFAKTQDVEKPLNPIVTHLFEGPPPASLREVADRYGRLFAEVEERRQKSQKVDVAEERLRQVLVGENSPTNIPIEGSKQSINVFLDEPSSDQLEALKRSVAEWTFSPAAPPHALILQDLPTQKNPRVLLRGKPDNPGEEVPRQFLGVLAGANRQPFKHGSGRLELAEAIAGRDNPLTARVMVNRIWLNLFGAGLVRTPSDFGMRSEPPSHPELLDYLAERFVDDGWSMKKLIRLIIISSVYQQNDDDNPQAHLIDPENHLLWRMNRRRLDFEAMRDSLLAAAGTLDPAIGGPSVQLTTAPFSNRRALYGFIDRENLPNMFRIFDFAGPETHSPQRFNTTIPQQALFMMNSPFVIEQARALTKRVEAKSNDRAERIQSLHKLLYQRAATPDEVTLAERFLEGGAVEGLEKQEAKPDVWQYGFGKYDEARKRVTGFTRLPYWTGDAWQGATNLPAPKLGRAMLTADGGNPGPDAEHAVIRRWVAPRDGIVTITGTLLAPPLFGTKAIAGDGVRGRIVSSRSGQLGSWIVHLGFADTNLKRVMVKRSETIDFVVDCRNDPYYDSFAWAPTIRIVEQSQKDPPGKVVEWSAANDFSGPREAPPQRLTALEKYAQVLLMTNEFMFVD